MANNAGMLSKVRDYSLTIMAVVAVFAFIGSALSVPKELAEQKRINCEQQKEINDLKETITKIQPQLQTIGNQTQALYNHFLEQGLKSGK